MKNRAPRILMILRHAKALRDRPMPDWERPLTDEGREQIKLMRRYAMAAGLVPDLVLTSDAVRAQATAEDFCKKFIPPPPLIPMRELYNAGGDDVLALIRAQADSVLRLLLVGHNPALEGVVMQLCSMTDLRETDFPTGALGIFTLNGSWLDLDAATVNRAEIVRPRSLSNFAV